MAASIMRPDTAGFCFWGYLKDKVYANVPKTTEDLKINICNEITGINPEIVRSVIHNFEEKIEHCKISLGEHLPNVIFQTKFPNLVSNKV